MQLELKKAVAVNLSKSLSAFISSEYGKDPAEFAEDLASLDAMRTEAINAPITQAGLGKIQRYFGHLHFLSKNKFPMQAADEDIKIAFGWHNSMGKEMAKPMTSFSVRFELAALLFNTAVIHAKMGEAEGIGSVDGLKKSCALYMTAAGIFDWIGENLSASVSLPAGSDLSQPALAALSQLMLARAQECFILKGTMDKSIRDGMLAKLGAAAGAMYDRAYDQASSHGKLLFPQHLLYWMQVKALLLHSMANYRKSGEHLAAGEYGREIGRLQMADQLVQEAKGLWETCQKQKDIRGSLAPELGTEINNVAVLIAKNLARALKDNSLIYHDNVPSRSSLPELGSATVARATAFRMEEWASLANEPVLFSQLPAIMMHRMVAAFYRERDQMAGGLLQKLGQSRTLIDQTKADLGLPAFLEALESGADAVPEAVLLKAKEVREAGGTETISTGLERIDEARHGCQEKLVLISSTLDDGKSVGASLESKYASLKAEVNAYQETLSAAIKADDLVRGRFDDNIAGILLLCGPERELYASVPTSSPALSDGEDLSVMELRSVFDQQASIAAKLDELAAKIQGLGKDPEELSNYPTPDEQRVYLDSLFADVEPSIKAAIEETAEHIASLRSKHGLVVQQQAFRRSSVMSARESSLQTIDDAYRHYQTLKANLSEGQSFYSGLDSRLDELKGRVEAFIKERDAALATAALAAGVSGMSFGVAAAATAAPTAASWNPNMPIQYGAAPMPPPHQQPPVTYNPYGAYQPPAAAYPNSYASPQYYNNQPPHMQYPPRPAYYGQQQQYPPPQPYPSSQQQQQQYPPQYGGYPPQQPRPPYGYPPQAQQPPYYGGTGGYNPYNQR